jgi:UTP-glucose-1-phosphate uridylyltransferase/mevalonate kinase
MRMKLFVPGRICLFGEHSDWAGGYRRINADLEKGYTLITGTNQGIHADVKPHPSKLILRATLNDGARREPYEVNMDRDALLAEAEKGGFFSYAAGVAYQVLTHYRVRGLEIDNTLTDLPVKKGLSSSAAICVLVARAFNRVYDLKMTVRGEMEFAYMGEITTPSRCGKMDQGCAYGDRPILMTFDGERMDIRELSVPRDLHFIIVDLKAGKDTKEILSKLNRCYPFAESELQKGVQAYLGPVNKRIVHEAYRALEAGDAARVGTLMIEAQREFDRALQPVCPSQLTAPVLHRLLAYGPIQPFILGGKGVGSQGDGTAQFIVKDAESQDRVVGIIEKELGMPCLKLVLKSGRRVRKAVIPAAGFGTRLFPASKAVKKELFPIIDRDGRAKPAILCIVEEAVRAGIEEIGIIVQSVDKPVFEDFFNTPPSIENYNKLSKEDQRYCDYLTELGHRITLLTQDVQEGFGHAVYCARKWVGKEAFLLMLGDHLYASETAVSCARQLVDIYEKANQSVVGLKVTPAGEIRKFGCAAGVWKEANRILSITEFAEKPEPAYAQEHLRVDGLDEGQFLTVFGLYVLTPKIFDFLEEHILHNLREGGEFQLTSCLDRLRQEEGFHGLLVRGRRFDIGMPDAYRETLIDFRKA